ncbi:carboxypeptidase-like regulatory domain-containing protein [Myxococcota bacterium]|nr:carboxypeptidase-like regulatory domain-containing protein [Myxococcota bacterium]
MTLRGAAGTFAPGPVPAGTYDITATFEGRPPAAAGQVTVPAGKEIELRCTSAFVKCVP